MITVEGEVVLTLELLLRIQVYLLSLRNLLQDILDDDSIVDSHVTSPQPTSHHQRKLTHTVLVGSAGVITYLGVSSIW